MRGRHDHKGQYKAIDQEHATVQMADINGSSVLHTSAFEHQNHQNIQVGSRMHSLPKCRNSPPLHMSWTEESLIRDVPANDRLPGNSSNCSLCTTVSVCKDRLGNCYITYAQIVVRHTCAAALMALSRSCRKLVRLCMKMWMWQPRGYEFTGAVLIMTACP